jgi:hypothetical protein
MTKWPAVRSVPGQLRHGRRVSRRRSFPRTTSRVVRRTWSRPCVSASTNAGDSALAKSSGGIHEYRIVPVGHQVVRERVHADQDREWVRGLPKGRKPRAVPIPRFVASALHEQSVAQAAQRTVRESVGPSWEDRLGAGVRRRGWRTVALLRRRPVAGPGVPRPRHRAADPHDLRRSCSSLLALEGVSARVRMAVLGPVDGPANGGRLHARVRPGRPSRQGRARPGSRSMTNLIAGWRRRCTRERAAVADRHPC